MRYYPYRTTRTASGVTPTDYGFTGQRNDTDIGLYYYNARWYSNVAGRFVSADTIVPGPANPQAFNRYSYVVGNPVRYTDPTGQCGPCLPIIGVAIALVVWLAYPEPVFAPEPGWTPPVGGDPNYGDRVYFDTAPGTGDIRTLVAIS